jgi:NADH kinase
MQRPAGRADDIDVVLTLGGDGTVLHAASLFPRDCPPFVSFAFGTVGFLTPFRQTDVLPVLRQVTGRRSCC